MDSLLRTRQKHDSKRVGGNTIMIQNELQLKNSKRWLKTLRKELEKMKIEYTHPQEFVVFTQGVKEQIEQIETEIKEYVKPVCPLPKASD
jgi:hypothetical protein